QIHRASRCFPNPALVDVTFARNPATLAAELTHLCTRRARPAQEIAGPLPTAAPRTSPLDQVNAVVKATEDLRVANGKLSAAAVAPAFDVPLSQLAGWLGRSRQAVDKTP